MTLYIFVLYCVYIEREVIMARKVVHISLSEEIYFKLKEYAKREHLKLSTWIRKKILDLLNSKGRQ